MRRLFRFFAAWLLTASAALAEAPLLSGSFHASAGQPGCWTSRHDGGGGQGSLRYGPLILGRSLALRVGGDAGEPGITLALVDAETGARLLLGALLAPGDDWAALQWRPPASWTGRRVYLVAEDRSESAWVGMSKPLNTWALWTPLLHLCLVHSAVFVLLLAPGLAWSLSRQATLGDVVLGSAAAGYAVFWVYVWSASIGRLVSVGLCLGCLVSLVRRFWFVRGRTRRAVAAAQPGLMTTLTRIFHEIRPEKAGLGRPLALIYFLGLAYLAVLVLYGGAAQAPDLPTVRFLPMPADTLLPFQLSDLWYQHSPVRPFVGDWLSSDRPPLQAGLNLLVAPLVPRWFASESVGIVAQSFIFLAFWSVLVRAGATAAQRATVIGFAAASGFFLFNCTFVWPKLLPAALLLLLFAELYFPAPRPATWTLGALAGLALMAHGASAFALVAISLWALCRPERLRPRLSGSAIVALAACVIPWALYARLLDPPGDRLLKWHLAGVVPIDPRPFGVLLAHGYAELGWRAALAGKWTNLRWLVQIPGSHPWADLTTALANVVRGPRTDSWAWGVSILRTQIYLFVPSFGAALAGLFSIGRGAREGLTDLSRSLAVILAVTLALWCLLMFRPGSTVNHQGTYFANAAGWLIVGAGLGRLPKALLWIVAALQGALFLGAWVFGGPTGTGSGGLLPAVQAPALLVAIAAAAAAALTLRSPRASAAP